MTFALGTVIAAGPGRVHPETGILITIAVAEGENVIYGKYDGNIFIRRFCVYLKQFKYVS